MIESERKRTDARDFGICASHVRGERLLSISYLLRSLVFRALGEVGVLDLSIIFIVDVTTPQAGALSAGPGRSLDGATDKVAHVIGNEYARHQPLIKVFVVTFRVFRSTSL